MVTPQSKFTKIRKWATEQGYKIEEDRGYGGLPGIKIYIDDKRNGFEVELRESTIRWGRKGQTGNAAGLYLAVIRNGVIGYGFRRDSQKEVIEYMGYELKQFKQSTD